jgi:hypothetical protein
LAAGNFGSRPGPISASVIPDRFFIEKNPPARHPSGYLLSFFKKSPFTNFFV